MQVVSQKTRMITFSNFALSLQIRGAAAIPLIETGWTLGYRREISDLVCSHQLNQPLESKYFLLGRDRVERAAYANPGQYQ
jgi:hypothetical protein